MKRGFNGKKPIMTRSFMVALLRAYILILISVVGFRLGGPLDLIILPFLIYFAYLNYLATKSIGGLLVLNLNLTVSMAVAFALSSLLYYKFIGHDSETLLVGQLMIQLGLVIIGLSTVWAVITRINASKNQSKD